MIISMTIVWLAPHNALNIKKIPIAANKLDFRPKKSDILDQMGTMAVDVS